MDLEFGYTLSSEEHAPSVLVENAARAEDAGFSFASISDHFHPWVEAQGHSPFVWAVLGSIAERTSVMNVAVGVTCPIVRLHPAIVAHAAATTSLLLEGRFLLGVGTGEALNEHILGDRWPTPQTRRDMLAEAIGVMRSLWSGDTVDHHGEHFTVENARLFDPPADPVPVIVSGFGEQAIDLAAEVGDGYWGHSPDRSSVERYERGGGSGPRFSQIDVCWAADTASARSTVHRIWPTGGLSGQLSQDLPTWTHFESATRPVRVEDATATTPCGPDPQPYVAAVQQFVEAGYDHLYFHQIGPDQEGFFEFWRTELGPALASERLVTSVS